MVPVKLLDEPLVKDELSGDPRAVLGAVSIPVHQELEATTSPADIQDASDGEDRPRGGQGRLPDRLDLGDVEQTPQGFSFRQEKEWAPALGRAGLQ